MKMEYSELKEAFANFRAEEITKNELIYEIGKYQVLNGIIPADNPVAFSPIITRNISTRIIGHYQDAIGY